MAIGDVHGAELARWSVNKKRTPDLGGFALLASTAARLRLRRWIQPRHLAKSKTRRWLRPAEADLQRRLPEGAWPTNGLRPANDSFTTLMGSDRFAKSAIAAASNSS